LLTSGWNGVAAPGTDHEWVAACCFADPCGSALGLNRFASLAKSAILSIAAHYSKDEASYEWANFQLKLIPEYWEEPELTEAFRKLVKSLRRRHREALRKSSGTAGEL
jgi:hypothetical protein